MQLTLTALLPIRIWGYMLVEAGKKEQHLNEAREMQERMVLWIL